MARRGFRSSPSEASVGQAVDTHRRKPATGRLCARTALAKLGASSVPIPSGRRGAPDWPSGVVGSITHCAGYRAATAARARERRFDRRRGGRTMHR